VSETPTTADELEAAIAKEYGTYVATAPIDIGGARAFNAGDPVPVSHIERGVVSQDKVAKLTTKSGRVAAGVEEKG
jgi:hypothetical protein